MQNYRLYIEDQISDERALMLIAMAFVGAFYVLVDIEMMDEGIYMNQFAQTIVEEGKVVFIQGWHGISFFAVPIYWLTQSSLSMAIVNILFGLVSIPLLFHLVSEHFDERVDVYAIAIALLMPFTWSYPLRGQRTTGFLFFVLLTLLGLQREARWAPFPAAIAGITYPFAIALGPLFLPRYLHKDRLPYFILAGFIPFLYVTGSYFQTGHFINSWAPGISDPGITKSLSVENIWRHRVLVLERLTSERALITPVIPLAGLIGAHQYEDRFWAVLSVIILNGVLVLLMPWFFSKYFLTGVTVLIIYAAAYIKENPEVMLLAIATAYPQFAFTTDRWANNFWSQGTIYSPIVGETNPFLLFWLVILLFLLIERDVLISAVQSRSAR